MTHHVTQSHVKYTVLAERDTVRDTERPAAEKVKCQRGGGFVGTDNDEW